MEEAELSHIDAREVVFWLKHPSLEKDEANLAWESSSFEFRGETNIGSSKGDAAWHCQKGGMAQIVWRPLRFFPSSGMRVDAFTKTSRRKMSWWICQARGQRS